MTHRLQADDRLWIGFPDTCDEFVLSAGHIECRPIKTFALPVRRQTSDDDDGVRLGREFLRGNECFFWINFLASSKPLTLTLSATLRKK